MGLSAQQAKVLTEASAQVCTSEDGQRVFSTDNVQTVERSDGTIEVTGSCKVTDGYELFTGVDKFSIILEKKRWAYNGVLVVSPAQIVFEEESDHFVAHSVPWGAGKYE